MATTRRSTKVKRENKNYDSDIARYNELIQQELDIPPRRAKGRKRILVKREPSDVIIPRKTRSSTRRVKAEPSDKITLPKPLTKPKKKASPRKILNLVIPKRPGYKSLVSKTMEQPKNVSSVIPPKLTDTVPTFEQKVRLDYTYPELIKLIKSNISNKNPELNTIDVSLHHNLVAKNIEDEVQRFAITDDHYSSSNYNACLAKPFVSDLDLFLESWNAGDDKSKLHGIPLV